MRGALAPDGVYSYGITATDRAGNVGSARMDNIIIDTRPTPVQLDDRSLLFLAQRRRDQGHRHIRT